MADYDSSLPIRTETDGDVGARIVGVTTANVAEVNADNELLVHDSHIVTELADINTALTDGSQKSQVVDGTGDVLEVNADGSINVVVQDEGASSTEKHLYGTVVAGVPSTPNTVVDYTVTAGKTFRIKAIQAAASGKFKYQLKTGTPAAETVKVTGFGSTADGSEFVLLPAPIEVAASDKILLIITNNDKANADVYGFVNGNEV